MDEMSECPWSGNLSESIMPQARQERRDAAEHRQRILEVARILFSEQGVEAVSMQQIAVAAGVGKGTLYRRYAHKGELCMDLWRERQESFFTEVATFLQLLTNAPVLERLDGVLAKTVSLLEEKGALLGCIAGTRAQEKICGVGSASERPSFQHSLWYRWLHELFANLLAEAVAQRELASSLDIPYVADAIMATLSPVLYRFQRRERDFSPERILQGVRSIYIQGLQGSSSTYDSDKQKN